MTSRPVPHRRRVAVVLFVGLCCRLGVALTTANADGMTLAWGSALLASGHLNPYQEVVEHPEHDPIPVEQISAVSLAQGPVGVAAGAATMWAANAVGLIEYGSEPDGTTFKMGELVAYKLSYLLPEALIVAALLYAVRRRSADIDVEVDVDERHRRERVALLAWATNPLIVFTWGQGMPDTWTVAVIVAVAVALATLADRDPDSRAKVYAACAALIPIGAFGTKMMPIVMLLPLAVVVVRDREVIRRRAAIVGACVGGLAIGVAPYVVSRAVRVNVLDRFELNMLNSKPGIPTLHAMPDAHLSLLAGVAVTMWFFSRREPRHAVVPWTVAAVVSVAAMSNIIPHLLFWASAPLLLLAVWRPALGGLFSAASGAMVAWHLVSYTWLANLVTRGLDSARVATGQPYQWVTQHVPAVPTVGGTVTSSFLLVVVGAAVLVVRGSAVEFSRPTIRNLFAVGGVGLVVGLGANVLLAELHGVSRWEFGRASTAVPFALTRDEPFTTPLLHGDGRANKILFKVDKATHANSDLIRVEIVDRNENRLAMGEIPVWVAEPASEKVAAEVSFPAVSIDEVKVRFSRIAVDDSAEAPVVLAGSIASVAADGESDDTGRTGSADGPSPRGGANDTQELPIADDDGNTDAGNIANASTPAGVGGDPATATGADDASAVVAQQQVLGPIFRLRETRAGDVPGLVTRRLLGPAGWIGLVGCAALAMAGAHLVDRDVRRGAPPHGDAGTVTP